MKKINKKAIKKLTKKAKTARTAGEALQFTQAALNLATLAATIKANR